MVDVERDRRPWDIFGVLRSGASEELESFFVCFGFVFNRAVSFMITDTILCKRLES